MAASFDPSKLAEALSRYGTESKETLSNLENAKKVESEMVDLAKQLGQVYKTNNDKFKESLKNKTLEEKITAQLEKTTEKIGALESARMNSLAQIKDNTNLVSALESKLLAHHAGIVTLSKEEYDITQKGVVDIKRQINLEEKLLEQSNRELKNIKIKNEFLKTTKGIFEGINKSVDFSVKLLDKAGDSANNLAGKLNIPTTFSGVLDKLVSTFNQIDTAATSVRQKFGLLRSEGQLFEKNIRETATELADFGVTAEQAGVTMKDIGSTFTSLQAAEKSLVKDVSLMSAQFGIASATSAKFLQTMSGITGKSAMSNKNMMGFAKMASTAYGVGLDDVMNDVANASDEARMFAGKNANEMVRAAAQARQMGTSLDNMAKTAKGLLDFESSIQNELKASALIGKNINFNEARRLAFQGKVVEANKLILDQAKKIKFNQLNPIAQEAFAQAAGKSVKELQDMLGAEQNLNDALKSQDPEVRKLAENRKKMAQTMEKGSAAEKAAQQKAFEDGIKREHNQERIKTIQNQINQLFMELAGPILEAIGPILEGVINYLKENKEQVKSIAMEIGKWFVAVKSFAILFSSSVVGPIGSTLTGIGKLTNGIFKFTQSLFKPVERLTDIAYGFEKISSKIKLISTEISSFGKGFRTISGFVGGVGNQFLKLSDTIFNIGVKVENLLLKFPKITKIGSLFSKVFGGVGNIISGTFGKLGGFFTRASGSVGLISKIGPLFGAVSKFLGPIGLVITVIQGATAFIKTFTTTTGTFSDKIKAGLKGVFETVILEPLKMVGDLIKKIPSLLAEIDFGAIFKDVTTYLLDALVSLPDMIEKLFTGSGGGGVEWGKIFMNIGNLFLQIFMFNVIKLPIAVATLVGKLGLLILKGIASLGITLLELIFSPFKLAFDKIVEFFGGKSPSLLGLLIVNGIKSVTDMVFESLTYPFKKSQEIIPEIINILKTTFVDAFKSIVEILYEIITFPFKKAFNYIKTSLSEVGIVFKDIFSVAFDFVINGLGKIVDKIKGIGGTVMNLAGKAVSFVSGIFGGGDGEETNSAEKSAGKSEPVKNELVDAIINSNRLVVERLDKLTQLMTSGQIAVYIDGQKANQLLAASSTKFGSLGQLTTLF